MVNGTTGEPAVTTATISEVVLDAAARHDRATVSDAGRGDGLRHAEFPERVRAAASALVMRGVRPADVGVLCLPGARDFVLALHALTAAGAIAVPVRPVPGTDELVAVLTESQARLMVTAESCLETALEAADRSYVRQVFAFGSVPAGVTSFAELLTVRPGGLPVADPVADVALRTYSPSGVPADFTHVARVAALHRMAGLAQLRPGDVMVSHAGWCSPPTWATLVETALVSGASFVAAGSPGDLSRILAEHHAPVAVLPADVSAEVLPPVRVLPLPVLTS
jgi:acyl-coenzyme A synthetase/AMP-(fatty) acid ligase